jgi:hypothetical protein
MKSLTASEKIAILEDKVAMLEIDLITSKHFKKFVRIKERVSDVFHSAGKKNILKHFPSVTRSSGFKKYLKMVKAKAGSNPVSQIEYILDSHKTKVAAPLSDFDLVAIGYYLPEITMLAIATLAVVVIFLQTIFKSIFGGFLKLKQLILKVFDYFS